MRRVASLVGHALETHPFALAGFVRLCMLAYGAWHDATLELKYTDIDYRVFTDGAELVTNGRCPFERPTYRYTPFLALLMTPNIRFFESYGKLLFAGTDLLVGAQIRAILLLRRVPPPVARRCTHVWLFNPLVLNVSTRGNFESLVALLVLASLLALLSKRPALAAAMLGASAHLKPFTVIYLPAFLVSIDAEFDGGGSDSRSSPSHHAAPPPPGAKTSALLPSRERIGGAARSSGFHISSSWVRVALLEAMATALRALSWRRAVFGTAFAASFGVLGLGSYAWCGEPYVREALLYHITRTDTAHNLSPYFYALYLTPPHSLLRSLVSLGAFVPQVVLLSVLARAFGRDLPFCLFVQTLVFVAFNKVCTVQYFIWYHSLLPLVLPSSAILLRAHRSDAASLVAAWVASLLAWLYWAYQLEFRGRQVYLFIWACGLLFLAANVAVACAAVRLHSPTPLFLGGRLARQACLYV